MQGSDTVRIAFIAFFTSIVMIVVAPDLALPWHPWSWYGFQADPSGNVTRVDPLASQSGLHVGDRFDIRRLALQDRPPFDIWPHRLIAPEGAVLHAPLSSGRTVTLVSHVYARSAIENVTDVLEVLSVLLYALIAASLVLLRPMPATWAFYAFSYSFWIASRGLFSEYAPFLLPAVDGLVVIAGAIAPIAFVAFALRFPSAQPKGAGNTFERILLYVIAPLFVLWSFGAYALYLGFAVAQPQWAANLFQVLAASIFGVGIAILLARYLLAENETRNRLQWVVTAFAVAFLPWLALQTFFTVFSVFPPLWLFNIGGSASLIAALALAYTVLKHRLFDIRLVVSRALIYGILTSLVVAVLALADWALGKWLEQSRFAFVAEVALALLIGFSLTTIHRRIEEALNGVIFRAQTLALQALRRFAQETDLISDPQRLLLKTYEALRTRLESTYAAIYTADGASFVLATPNANATPPLFPGDDFAVLRLRRWSESFECDEPDHPLRGGLLVPMTARTLLVGFIAVGPKRDRTHYLPEEIDTLSTLAHRTASSYAWLTLRPTSDERFVELSAPSTTSD